MEFAFYLPTDDPAVLRPTDLARSLWAGGQLHGVALAAGLARSFEQAMAHRSDLRPARMSVDLFRAVPMADCRFEVTIVREGPRIALVDGVLTQDGVTMTRASAVFLKVTTAPAGKVWQSDDRPEPPPISIVPVSDEPRVPLFRSDNDWSDNFGNHQNAGRKQTWQSALPIVAGERPTPFQAVAGIADSTSLVTNWGDRGVEFINTDITLTLARMPVSLEIGLEAVDHVEHDGISVGTATVFDREGVLGSAMVTALANARSNVDFKGIEYTEDGSPVR